MFTGNVNTITLRERDLIIAMVSSIIFIAIIFFLLGYIFHLLWKKRKQSTMTSASEDVHDTQSHVQLPRQHQALMLEMAENVCYGPLKRNQ